MEQELPTLPGHLSLACLDLVRVAGSSVLHIVIHQTLSFNPLSFDHSIICRFSIYSLLLRLWYLQAFQCGVSSTI